MPFRWVGGGESSGGGCVPACAELVCLCGGVVFLAVVGVAGDTVLLWCAVGVVADRLRQFTVGGGVSADGPEVVSGREGCRPAAGFFDEVVAVVEHVASGLAGAGGVGEDLR